LGADERRDGDVQRVLGASDFLVGSRGVIERLLRRLDLLRVGLVELELRELLGGPVQIGPAADSGLRRLRDLRVVLRVDLDGALGALVAPLERGDVPLDVRPDVLDEAAREGLPASSRDRLGGCGLLRALPVRERLALAVRAESSEAPG
jgi:hypothetical protein